MKNAIRCALCLLMAATSLATYASDGSEVTNDGDTALGTQMQQDEPVAVAAPISVNDGYGSGEPMSADARSERDAIDELNRERVNRENWAPSP